MAKVEATMVETELEVWVDAVGEVVLPEDAEPFEDWTAEDELVLFEDVEREEEEVPLGLFEDEAPPEDDVAAEEAELLVDPGDCEEDSWVELVEFEVDELPDEELFPDVDDAEAATLLDEELVDVASGPGADRLEHGFAIT